MANKPTLSNIESGRLNAATVDGNFDTLADNHVNLLGRGGVDESSNFMLGDLDMNKNRIRNVATPVASGDAVSLSHLNTILGQDISSGLVTVYETFTATSGQTLFTFANATYTQSVNQIVILIQEAASSEKGYRRLAPSEFEETSTSSFTLISAASLGDKIVAYISQPLGTTDPSLIPAGETFLAARDEAVTAASDAEDAKDDAEAAQLAAEAAQLAAETAQVLAEDAQAAAEAARDAIPAVEAILADSDIGVTVLAPDGDGSRLTGILPAGTVCFFDRTAAPDGWLPANGASISQTTYADLYAVVGDRYVDAWANGEEIAVDDLRASSAGVIYVATVAGTTSGTDVDDDTGVTWDVSTLFVLPDLRGEFLRGLDSGRGVDTGRVLGSNQADAMQRITGSIGSTTGLSGLFGNELELYDDGMLTVSDYRVASGGGASNIGVSKINIDSANSVSPNIAKTDDVETRPRNVALLACIKY